MYEIFNAFKLNNNNDKENNKSDVNKISISSRQFPDLKHSFHNFFLSNKCSKHLTALAKFLDADILKMR